MLSLGLPKDNSRGTIVVTGPDQSMAVFGACDKCQNIALRSVQFDGNRPILGPINGGAAILEMGGNTKGQTVDNCHIFE